MSEVDFLVKLRDAACQIKDACEERLDKLGPPGTQTSKPAAGSEGQWDPSKIRWEQKTGDKGPYERSQDTQSPDFKAMLADLKTHKGKLTRDGSFYWSFTDGNAVGRKPKKNRF